MLACAGNNDGATPVQKTQRRQGLVQFQSAVIIGALGLGGATAFGALGASTRAVVTGPSNASGEDGIAVSQSPSVGSSLMAALSGLPKLARLGELADGIARVADDAGLAAAVQDLYPPKLRLKEPASSVVRNAPVDASELERVTEVFVRQLQAGDAQRAAYQAVNLSEKQRIYLGLLLDVERDLGDRFDMKFLQGSFSATDPINTAVVAPNYIVSGAEGAVFNLEVARPVLSERTFARLEAAFDFYRDGVTREQLGAAFALDAETPAKGAALSTGEVDEAMMSVLGRFRETVGSAEIRGLSDSSAADLFDGLTAAGFSDEAASYLREVLEERVIAVSRERFPTNRGAATLERRVVEAELVKAILAEVVRADPDAAEQAIRLIDAEQTLFKGYSGKDVETLIDAARMAASSFEPSADALPWVSDALVEGALLDRIKLGTQSGLPDAFTNFLRRFIKAPPKGAPGRSRAQLLKLFEEAARYAAVGDERTVRGINLTLRRAIESERVAAALTDDLESFARRFAEGRGEPTLPVDDRAPAVSDFVRQSLDGLEDGAEATDDLLAFESGIDGVERLKKLVPGISDEALSEIDNVLGGRNGPLARAVRLRSGGDVTLQDEVSADFRASVILRAYRNEAIPTLNDVQGALRRRLRRGLTYRNGRPSIRRALALLESDVRKIILAEQERLGL